MATRDDDDNRIFAMENILNEIPKWVGHACKRIGAPGKGRSGSHLWNPAILGFCCINEATRKKWVANKKKMGDFLQKYFNTFYPQWEELTGE